MSLYLRAIAEYNQPGYVSEAAAGLLFVERHRDAVRMQLLEMMRRDPTTVRRLEAHALPGIR